MTNEKVLDHYARELSDARDLKDSTVNAYRRECNAFATFIGKRNRTLLEAKREDFLDYKKAADREPNGMRVAIAAIKGLYLFLDDQKFLRPSPFPTMMMIKTKRQEPTDVPTVSQFLQIRTALEALVTDPRCMKQDARRLAVELLAGAGLRIEALMTLKPKFCRFGNRPIIMVEASEMSCKGKIAGEIPVSPYAAELLRRYISENNIGLDDVLFDCSMRTVSRTIERLSTEELHLHPHTFRHFYCSMTYYRNFDGDKNDIVWVRDAAGHSSMSTTDGYLKMARRVCQDDASWETWAHGQPRQDQREKSA